MDALSLLRLVHPHRGWAAHVRATPAPSVLEQVRLSGCDRSHSYCCDSYTCTTAGPQTARVGSAPVAYYSQDPPERRSTGYIASDVHQVACQLDVGRADCMVGRRKGGGTPSPNRTRSKSTTHRKPHFPFGPLRSEVQMFRPHIWTFAKIGFVHHWRHRTT